MLDADEFDHRLDGAGLGMQLTFWALVLKPFIGIVMLAGMVYIPHFIAWVLRPLIPNGRFKDSIYKGWGGRSTDHTAGAGDQSRRLAHDG